MLKLIGEKPRSEDEFFQEKLKLIQELDGFLVIGIKDNKILPIKYCISDQEIIYAIEYLKSKLFSEGDVEE